MNSEFLDTLTQLFTPIAILTFGMVFFISYRKDKERQNRIEFEKLNLEKGRLESRTSNKENSDSEDLGAGSGGFIVIDLPNEQKSVFHDLLKGFEDFATLKGYSISFSIDNSLSNKIGFKFTLNDSGISVSTNKVRSDIQEYIQKVRRGDSLDNLPVIISAEEHELIVTQMKNRISFLEHNYNLEKNSAEFYENLVNKLKTNNGITAQPTVFVQTGGTNSPQHYLATNSPGAIQGNDIKDIYNEIKIAKSFNDRKNQIEDLQQLINLVKTEKSSDSEKAKIGIIKNLEKVKDELEEESEPDKRNVSKWLEKAKSYFEVFKFGEDIYQTAKKVFASFDITTLF